MEVGTPCLAAPQAGAPAKTYPREQFFSSELEYDATLRNLEILGEAAKKVPDELKHQYPSVDWRGIAGFRDVLAHAYFALDEDTLWDIITRKVPELIPILEAALAESS
jgi:uncharacterized protein with HEPN domain